ncbi:TPA: helix-turn-helix domain-containing protein [Streptococcus equi subsp. zooepidemicus]|uniref:AraC family transcriptional regulator n=1 Tax=Streptococcus equi TaxID=1336 RepID=UPI001E3E97F8|nr:helix-turn-helix domain-containing protein [Streptococcus equi]MCD3458707.1 helix-turn-helix domain-containing protein [Streptococcus equi subsp. zooepidemicus]MDI5903291.1 helix-turn-helix domain-containing protein [Streptococcus equi subsp. zooepidemicus]MDI5932044.1 helix-turn-helix domain-containing protein [Streptococcus equi subsp. zooepidemicus]MDI6031290.1 helix-turn-helix domain-containing protein [Streptococcus equi subsp. zooepidemicus]HEL0001159.1 helix-turn-helix domain-contain
MYKLLIVEDEHIIRKWLRYAIDYHALNILVIGEAKDGQQGARLIAEAKPDIVLTDINMPIMTAFEMFEATKEQSYAKIILSGYADFANAKSAIHYGVLEFLTKPLERQALHDCLLTIIQKLQQQSQEQELSQQQDYLKLPQPNDQLPDVVQEMLSWIHEHYQDKIMIGQLAHDLGYSESHLYHLAKKYLKMTFSDYINQYRLNRAIQLLIAEPDVMVYQLAEAVGIYDYRYFDRVFKKYLGQTVKDFRETVLHQGSDRSSL